ncbi:MAG: gamma-glutamylcyclotransferase family protein [Granulosicoccus sp.]
MANDTGVASMMPVTRFAPLGMIYMASDWISYFGYGSLVNRDTRPPHEEAEVARLRGWQRVWEHRTVGSSAHAGCTSLSIRPDTDSADASIEGVIVKLPRAQLAQLDEREAGYERLELPAAHFDLADHHQVDSVMVYRSLPENRRAADPEHPVLQSYIDCVLAGYHKRFAERGLSAFIASTVGWEGAIFNDRRAPRYPRSVSVAQDRQARYDAMIQQHLASLPRSS